MLLSHECTQGCMADPNEDPEERRQQSSLDAFTAIREAVVSASGANSDPEEEVDSVTETPPAPTLSPPEQIETPSKIENIPVEQIRGSSPVKTFQLPSSGTPTHRPPATDVDYHDLEEIYPDAPVPSRGDGMVFHRAILHELSGVPKLLDWVSDGDAAIVELSRIINRDTEFSVAVDHMSVFIESDIGGQIIQLTDTRLLLLPPGCKGITGIELEAFASET